MIGVATSALVAPVTDGAHDFVECTACVVPKGSEHCAICHLPRGSSKHVRRERLGPGGTTHRINFPTSGGALRDRVRSG